MAEKKIMTNEQKKQQLAEELWLKYYNVLFEKGLITEADRNRMANTISARNPIYRVR